MSTSDGAEATGRWPPTSRSLSGPLAGLRVLDLSRVLAEPWVTMVLGDMGADVIKVESPVGDATRGWGPPFVGETAVYYLAANRNKRSVVLDLTLDSDREVARRLAEHADVLVENFRPGRAATFGLGYVDVSMLNDRCVDCSITGFGSGTTREAEPAYDLVVQAIGGMMGVTGVDGEPPVKVGVATADLLAGLYASPAILGALIERERTGVGRQVDVALIDTQIAGLTNQALNWLVARINPPRLGSDHPNVAPYGAFATSAGYIVVAGGNDRQFAELAALVGHPEWVGDGRFVSNRARVANREALRAEIERKLRTLPADTWLSEMRARGVPCAPVLDVADVFEDPEIRERPVVTIPDTPFGSLPRFAAHSGSRAARQRTSSPRRRSASTSKRCGGISSARQVRPTHRPRRLSMARPDGAPAINAGMTVVEGIGDLIQRRELLPGEPVRQQDMAERLNESRVSVREALRALETEGLLRHPPNQSYFVTKFGVGQLNQMYLMRRLLETALLRDIIWPDDVPLRAINAINEELRQASHDGEVSLLV